MAPRISISTSEMIANPRACISRSTWEKGQIFPSGCLNGCPYCYARKLANGRLKTRYLANKNWPTGDALKLFLNPGTDPFHAKLKYLSFEPLLEWNVEAYVMERNIKRHNIDWVIIGAQTRPYKPPRIEWVKEIVEACDRAGIPVFLKDNLRALLPKERPYYLPVCADVDGRDPCRDCDVKESCHSDERWQNIRQEMPK